MEQNMDNGDNKLGNANGGMPKMNMENPTGDGRNPMSVLDAASLFGWWSMAQLAAQDYISRLRMSGVPFPPGALNAQGKPELPGNTPGDSGVIALTGADDANRHASGDNASNASKQKYKDKRAFNTSQQQSMPNTSSAPVYTSTNNNNTSMNLSASKKQEGTDYTRGNLKNANNNNSARKKSFPTSQQLSSTPSLPHSYDPTTLHKELMAMQAAAAAGPNSAENMSAVAAEQALDATNNAKNYLHSYMENKHMSKSETDKNRFLKNMPNFSIFDTQEEMTAARGNTYTESAYGNLAHDKNFSQAALSEHASLLGVRLPPDTEIIKYTSNVFPETGANAKYKKTDETVDVSPPKRARVEESAAKKGNSKENMNDLLKNFNNQSTVLTNPFADAEKPNMSYMPIYKDKTQSQTTDKIRVKPELANKFNEARFQPTAVVNIADDTDSPLNLCLKETKPRNEEFNAQKDVSSCNSLQSLSSITAALGSSNNRNKKSNNGSAKPPCALDTRDTTYDSNNALANRVSLPMFSKEGRPRNLGRGVSKPKKNTVASLLAQSRAVGVKPLLTATQLINYGSEKNKLRLDPNLATDASTDSDNFASESGLSESECEDVISVFNMQKLRLPLNLGWKRETIIHGLTKTGQIRGEVSYYAPNSNAKLKSMDQIFAVSELVTEEEGIAIWRIIFSVIRSYNYPAHHYHEPSLNFNK